MWRRAAPLENRNDATHAEGNVHSQQDVPAVPQAKVAGGVSHRVRLVCLLALLALLSALRRSLSCSLGRHSG